MGAGGSLTARLGECHPGSPRVRPRRELRGRALAGEQSSAIWIAFSAAPLRRLSHGEEEREAVARRRVAADAADEHVVAAGRLARRREVLEAHRRRGAEQLPRLLWRERSSVSIQTASAWPTITGTRTQVA